MQNTPAAERMQCMEVWGGNVRVAKHFEMPGLDVWVACQPHGESAAGGDVYYLSSCASGRITRILLADVSGHGALVARTAAGLRDLMRRNINVISQRRFMAAMNRQFADISREGHFATAVVSSFFAPTQSLALCNAGHPNALLFRSARGEWIALDAAGLPSDPADAVTDLPFGVADQAGYVELNDRLHSGDMVLCYTDAFSDALGADGRALGVDGMRRTVAAIDPGRPSWIDSLVEAIRAMHPDNLSQDDATLMLFRANGTGTTLRDNILAPLRLLRRASDVSRIALLDD